MTRNDSSHLTGTNVTTCIYTFVQFRFGTSHFSVNVIINTAQNTYLPCMHACLNVFLYNASYCFTMIKTCWLGPSGSLWLLQTHKQGDALAFLIVKEGGEKGVFHCEGQSGASGYCKSMMLYDILLSLTTGMPLKGAVMSVCCVCARTVCMCRVRVSDFLQDFDLWWLQHAIAQPPNFHRSNQKQEKREL